MSYFRVLVLSARGIGHRGRHLLQDVQSMMPHSKTDSKMQKKESLFDINEIAEMKNCGKCLLFEGRKGKDVFMWAANVARGPSVKFEVGVFLCQVPTLCMSKCEEWTKMKKDYIYHI